VFAARSSDDGQVTDHDSSTVRTVLFECRSGLVEDLRVSGRRTGRARSELFSPDFQVSLPYHGLCVWHVGRDDVVADATRVKFIRGGEGYRVSRPVDGGHGEMLVTVPPALLSELLGVSERRLADHDLFRARSRPADPRLQRMGAECLARRGRPWSALAQEEWLIAFLRQALASPPCAQVSPALVRTVARAKEYLATHHSDRTRLDDVAEAVGVAPAYLTTLFRRVEGMPLYRYSLRLRLSRALVEIPDTRDLTRLAVDLGFAHHSHFTAAFRRTFGCTPSAFRKALRPDAPLAA
jgi:AraC family transcriptional regulator